ncbi:MAG TPA: 50S ribosomal protein L24 [Paracoccaceae bacterium]|nr:50S ribosomal protein L24 [Paracoccaceae bacterium]
MAAKLKKGDTVIVLAGKDKGKEGEILSVMPQERRALVKGINLIIRHQRQTAQSQGGRIRKEAPIDLSNLALKDPKSGEPTRVGFRVEGDRKVRFAKKSGEVIDV